MKLKALITWALFIFYTPAYSQVDYNDMRLDVLMQECGGFKDSALVQANIDTLHTLANSDFKNKNILYRDLGHNYYLRWAATKKDTLLTDAIHFFQKSIESKPKYGPTYLELALCLYFQNNCQRALENLEFYQLHTNRKYQDTSQVHQIKNLCK